MSASSGFSQTLVYEFMSAGLHQVELQYYQCRGASGISVSASGPATGFVDMSLWALTRHGTFARPAFLTAPKTGADVEVSIPAGTAVPGGATHLLAFAQASSGFDSLLSTSTALLDFVQPTVAAEAVSFNDVDPTPGVIQGVITIRRAQNEDRINAYKVYWGSSATDILNISNSTARRLSTSRPSCTGLSCSDIQITGSGNSWVVSRGSYDNHESADIILTGPAEIMFLELNTETCCDKLYFPQDVFSGYTTPEPLSLGDGTHAVQWVSDFSVTSGGWSFSYTYLGSSEGTSPSLIAMIPKPEHLHDLQVQLERQQLIGSHFIVKAAYDSTESDTSVAVEIQDLAPEEIPVGNLSFSDTHLAMGYIGGSLEIGQSVSGITGYRIYWGSNSTHLIAPGFAGLEGQYFYLSYSPDSIPDMDSLVPDLVKIDLQVFQAQTLSAWPGLSVEDNFAVRWTGYVKIEAAGMYRFTLDSDEGSRLFINGALVVDNDGVHGMQSSTGEISLVSGFHSLQLNYFEGLAESGMILEYSGPDTAGSRVVIPQSALRHGSLNNALIGEVVAASSSATVLDIQNLSLPEDATHLIVRAFNDQGESLTGASVELNDAFRPTSLAGAVQFVDEDPTEGLIAGTIVVEAAADPSTVSHYVIYWGSSSDVKLDQVPLAEIESTGGSGNQGSCGLKGEDTTPLRFSRNGVNGPKIVNGQDASHCEWRWQVSLRYSSGFHFCGGALISPKWVMSAAHCVDGAGSFVVVVGDYDKDSPSDAHERTHSVHRVISHESYDSYTMSHDFALIELEQEVDMTQCVGTACLPDAHVEVGQDCYITGWGTLSSGGSTPARLQEGLVIALSNTECNARYAGEILDDMLCAQGTAAGGIVDACQGDSGGPLVCQRADGRHVLHGATSWGYGCAQAQYPGVWARIASILPWIHIHTGLQSPGDSSVGNLTYNLSSQSIPSSATHLLVYTAMHGAEMESGISIPLVDYAPVDVVPSSINFTDEDASPGELGGVIHLGRASDETQVTGYAVYWGSSETQTLELLAEVSKGSGTLEIAMATNTPLPSAATHLLGFAITRAGRGLRSVSQQILDVDDTLSPGGLVFEDTDASAGLVGGTVTVQRAASTSGISAYNLYFSDGNCSTLGAQIASVAVSQSGRAPLCIEGNACSDITITQEASGRYVISRGMSGYRNDEHAKISVDGPGSVHFSRFSTEMGYDMLRVDQASFSGEALPASVALGPGPKEIEWTSDYSVTRDGWVVTFEAQGSFGDVGHTLPNGTFLPAGASRMLAFSVANGAEYRQACASTPVVDYAPPNQVAQNVWFEDEDSAGAQVAGTITILQARQHTVLLEYRIYWGMTSTTRLPNANMLLSVVASSPGTNLTAVLSATALPTNATHLLVFSASAQGEAPRPASTEIVDFNPAQETVQNLSFTDTDSAQGVVSGSAQLVRASDESTIESYNLYFSNGQQKISFVGSAPAPAGAARPSCRGDSCAQISITSVAAAYEVSRGTSYNNNEEAVIVITGPGLLRFTFFNTEAGYDFLQIMGTPYSGNQLPADIPIPASSHEIVWRSDGSVTTGGWVFQYEGTISEVLSIPVPQSTIPTGAVSLLAVTSGAGGEMDVGVTTPLEDYHPPMATPQSVQCQDQDTSIGVIQGTCTVRRAASEDGVTAYVVYWGMNATHAIEGVPMLGVVTLADSALSVDVPIAQTAIHSGASHLLAFAAGPGGVAPQGVSTLLVDNAGLTLSPSSLDILGTPNSTVTGSVTINNAGTSGVTLNVELLFDTGSAEGSSSAAGSSSSPSSSSSSSSSSAYTLPSACLQGSLPVGKNRLIFKAKADTKEARRLHAKNLESRHGAKVKSFDHLGGLAFAELKNTSLKSYCQLFVDLENDPLVAFVEEDKTWHAIGNTIQVEEDLFLSPGKKPLPRPRVGRMHRSQSASSNARSTPNDDEFDELWGLHQGNDVDIDAPEAWAIHQGLNGRVIIAVIDTGVDYNHEDLRNQMWTNPGEIPGDGIDNDDNGFVDDVYGYNFYAGNGDPMDSNGHGTHCAGTIGAEAGNSVGVAGVSWKPQIMALKFLGPNGGSTSDAIRSVDYAVQMGAQISSNSWGGGGVSEALRAAITEAANQNHLFIVAAGNDAQNNEVTPSYPCNYNLPNMICVASTDSQNDISSFSNWGTNVVHIAAPGSRIYSTYPNNGYASLSGTSMATPHVSGVAALVLDYVPTLTYRELRQLILDSAVRFDKFASKVSTGALLNAHAALVMASDHAWARLTAPTTGAVTVPAQGSATISVELGGPRLEQREYRARLRIWSLVGDILYSRLVPILYTLHEFGSGPTVGPVGLEFADVDGGRGVIAGALTITRASPEEEATFSQYHIFWADASERRMSEAPFAALDTGSLLHDDFAFFDSSFWFAADSDTWSVSEGAAVFWGPYATSHLALARRFAPPFTVKTKAKKASGALAHMVVQIGGSDASLFGVASGVRAMFLGSQKVLVASDGHHESVPCTLGTWFEVTITVRSNSVTFADNQGCPEIVIPANIETTQHIRIGADCTGDCATNGGSMWEYFEVSGGLYATFNVPVNTLIPTNATGFVAHAWNVLGLQLNGVYAPVADHRVAVRAAQPQDVRASSPSTNPTSSLMVSWTRGLLNDCSSHFQRYEVSAQDSNSDWFAVQGCQNLVNLNSQSCLATELSSDVPYQFKVRVVCSLEETQSFWSEISATAVTHPLPAAAPTQVRARLPSSSVLLVSWQTEMMNDCEFVESVVEAQVVGQSSWFRPEGCTGLTLLNSYHCTAQALIPDTSYIFRVQTSCSDPLSSSGYSSSSTPASTLASAQDWESSQRRMLSVSMTSDLDYNTVLSTPNLKQGLIARIISDTATRLNVDASKVQVEVLAGSTLSSSRRLSTVSTVFAVTVEGVDETETPDTTSSMAQGVAFAVQAETGTASEVSVSSALSLTAATAPERILWTDLGDGSVQLTWNARPLNDCSFLAWHVVALSGSSELSPAGCSNLVNLSKTSCTVSGLDQSRSYMFAVSVLCADPAASSQRSETSDAWPLSPLPGLVSAEFSEDFSALLLTFHRVVTAAELVPTTCTDAFGNVTRDALGSGITCKVIGSQMRVTLGEGASLLLGEIIHMNTARGSAAVTSRSKAPSVVSILSATPSVTQACDPVVLLLQASGAAGRALNIKWMTDRPGSLQNLLDSATEDSASSLTLSPTLLQEILATVEGDSASITVNVSVQVSNWLGQNATASAAVTLLKSASLIASIQASGPAQLVRQFDDPLELEVTTSIGSTCESNLEAKLTTTWHYRPSDSATWMTLAEAGLSDLSAMPNILRLAPYALPSGSHELRATAAFEGAVGESDSLAFSITVESPTLDFEISGPQSVGVGCGFELGATVAASHPDAVLTYQWACLQPDNCNSIANFAASAEVLDGSGYSGARLAVAPANVSQGAYTFSVTVTMHIASMPSEPSVSLQKEVSVLVEPGGPLPVEIITPWSSMDHISVQATRLAEAVVARVGSMADECKVPGSLVYKWVLATAAEPSQIVASLDTKVVLSGLATVTSISFEGNALLPSVSYVYALLRAESSSQLTQGEQSATLQDAASLGISVSKSSPFVADAAPSAGLAVATPEMGEALKTKFVLSTAGWSDEDDSLSLRYAFYLFPVAGSFNITVGEDGKLRSSPAFQPPLINWDDPDSAEYWVKLGGLAVRGFGSAASAESRLPSNTFVTVARARDKLGAVADSAVLGPVVQQPASLSTSDLTDVLAESQTSSDPSQILMSVQTVMSMSGSVDGESSAVTAMALDALASVTTMVDGSDETLQQMGTAVTQVIAGSAADKSSLTKAADVIESCLALASDGVSAAAGASLLGGIASIGGSSSQLDSTEVKSVSSKLTSLVSDLGQAAVKFLQAGEVQEINSVDESGEGIKMAVTKQSSAEVASLGVQMQRLSIPAGAFAGRRLDASCGEMEVQVTEWLKSNPYSYTQKVVGSEGSVAESAEDVFSVEITSCSFPAVVLEPVSVSLPLPSFGAGSDFVPTCARFDSSSDSWTSDGVSTSIDSASGKVTCSSTHTKTSYAVFADVGRPLLNLKKCLPLYRHPDYPRHSRLRSRQF
ncbi:unnamed protein product [Effrenium voratum]|nr:unnamed protein product [Effrenium voratum]